MLPPVRISAWLLVCVAARSPIYQQVSELERLSNSREAEVKYLREQNELEILKTGEMANIETKKFKKMVDAIGATTLQAIATSGPDMQVCNFFNTLHLYGIPNGNKCTYIFCLKKRTELTSNKVELMSPDYNWDVLLIHTESSLEQF